MSNKVLTSTKMPRKGIIGSLKSGREAARLKKPPAHPAGITTNPTDGTTTTNDLLRKRRTQKIQEMVQERTAPIVRFEIGIDYSASIKDIATTLKTLAKDTIEEMVHKVTPKAEVTYGIFGGGGLVHTGKTNAVLDKEHQTTGVWESTLDQYLFQYTSRLTKSSSGRPCTYVNLTFNDASTNNSTTLHTAVEELKAHDVTTIMCYVPTIDLDRYENNAEHQERLRQMMKDDQAMLKQITDSLPDGKGHFILLSEVKCDHPEILSALIQGILKAIIDEQNEKDKSGKHPPPNARRNTQRRLDQLVARLVDKSKQLTA
jgi:hypothetical protein